MTKLKKYKLFRPLILSRHPSHSILRAKNQTLPLLPFRSVIRLGSSTESDGRLEINTAQAVKNSASKLLMKKKFTEAGVKTASWCTLSLELGTGDYKYSEFDAFKNNSIITEQESDNAINTLNYPIVAKSHFGSRGVGEIN